MLPYVSEPSFPSVDRTTWHSWHTNPNNLPTELAGSLIRWHVHDAFTGYWLAYDVAFLAQGQVTVSPAGPLFIRYRPYYETSVSEPCAGLDLPQLRRGSEAAAALEAGTVALDPGCTSPNQACLTVPEIVRWCVPPPDQLPDQAQRTVHRRAPVAARAAEPDTAGVQHVKFDLAGPQGRRPAEGSLLR